MTSLKQKRTFARSLVKLICQTEYSAHQPAYKVEARLYGPKRLLKQYIFIREVSWKFNKSGKQVALIEWLCAGRAEIKNHES